jgi:hypothetical protein
MPKIAALRDNPLLKRQLQHILLRGPLIVTAITLLLSFLLLGIAASHIVKFSPGQFFFSILIIGLITPTFLSVASGAIVRDTIKQESYELLEITMISSWKLIVGFVTTAIYRARYVIALWIGVIPVIWVMFLMFNIGNETPVCNLDLPSYDTQQCFSGSVILDALKSPVIPTLAIVCLLGLNVFAVVLSVYNALVREHGGIALYVLSGAILIGLILFIFWLIIRSADSYQFAYIFQLGDVPQYLAVISPLPFLGSLAILWLSRHFVRRAYFWTRLAHAYRDHEPFRLMTY